MELSWGGSEVIYGGASVLLVEYAGEAQTQGGRGERANLKTKAAATRQIKMIASFFKQ